MLISAFILGAHIDGGLEVYAAIRTRHISLCAANSAQLFSITNRAASALREVWRFLGVIHQLLL